MAIRGRTHKNIYNGGVADLVHKAPFRLRPHHAKPMRKRHVVLLATCLVVLVSATIAAQQFIYAQYNKRLDARLAAYTVHEASVDATDAHTVVRHSAGFNLAFQSTVVAVTATEAGSPLVYTAQNLATERAYRTITFRQTSSMASTYAGSKLEVLAPGEAAHSDSTTGSRQQLIRVHGNGTGRIVKESERLIGGVMFTIQTYDYTPGVTARNGLQPSTVRTELYAGVMPGGQGVIMRLAGITDEQSTAVYRQIITSFSTLSVPERDTVQPVSSLDRPSLVAVGERLGLVGRQGQAAAPTTGLDTARIVATNAAAVVKLYRLTCGSIQYRGQPLTEDGCAGSAGSGFLISGDGYIATNGHVVSSDPRETLVHNLSPALLNRMLEIDGYSAWEIKGLLARLQTDAEFQAAVAGGIQKLSADDVRYSNKKEFYIVALGRDMPQFDAIAKDRTFRETSTLRLATLKGIDYDPGDMYNQQGFTRSDVAVLKITGKHYPTVKLGKLDAVVQGAPLMVLGYPSEAETNGLVKSDTVQSTATQGIVSAIREVNGGSLKVVQSDVAIGRGNSGGPAFDQSGAVFGLATYVLPSQNGDPSVSYLRDIEDLRRLLAANFISLAPSDTQTVWEEGLEAFYGAHYTEAITKFQAAQRLYGPHVLADQYIALAKTKIANGEEAESNWTAVLLAGVAVTAITGLAVTVVIMSRHRTHHHVYRALQAGYLSGPFAHILQAHHVYQTVPIESHSRGRRN
jgi:S1-C subfamily serine protease